MGRANEVNEGRMVWLMVSSILTYGWSFKGALIWGHFRFRWYNQMKNVLESVVMPFIVNITMEINFSSKVYSKSLLKGSVTFVVSFT